MAKHRDNNKDFELEGRDEFVRENAVALLNQRDTKIQRLRKQVAALEKVSYSRKVEIRKLQEQVADLELRLSTDMFVFDEYSNEETNKCDQTNSDSGQDKCSS